MAKAGKGDRANQVNARRAAGRTARSSGAPGPAATNPFERIKARKRRDVLGLKLKGTERVHGVARSRAVENRRATLLREFRDDGKINEFKDARIGEGDETLPEEDKMLLRFQAERGLGKKVKGASLRKGGSGFALSEGAGGLMGEEHLGDGGDDDSGDELLKDALRRTATGVSGMRPPRVDEDGGEGLDAEDTAHHFGGGHFEEGAGRYKTRNEIMAEVVAKSKAAKAERQREREEREAVTAHLDSQFDDIMDLVTRRPTKADVAADAQAYQEGKQDPDGAGDGSNAANSGPLGGLRSLDDEASALLRQIRSENAAEERAAATTKDAKAASKNKRDEDYDAYDMAVRSLTFERRVAATTRTKTEEEIAIETAKKLQEEEARRQRRMRGAFESDDEVEGLPVGGFARRRERRRDAARAIEELDQGENPEVKRRRIEKSTPVRPGGNFGTEGEDGSEGEEDSGDGGSSADGDGSSGDQSDSDDSDDSEGSSAKERGALRAIRHAKREARGEDPAAGSSSSSSEDGHSDSDSDSGDEEDSGDESGGSTDSNPLGFLGAEDAADPEQKRREAAERQRRRRVRDKLMKEARTQLPFTFDVPADYDSLAELLGGRSLEDVSTILDRMAACNHVSLDPRNRARLGRMVGLLLDHIHALCAFEMTSDDGDSDDSDNEDGGKGKGKGKGNTNNTKNTNKRARGDGNGADAQIERARDEVNVTSRVLARIAKQTPTLAVKAFRTRLVKLSRRLRRTLSGVAGQASTTGWPDARGLVFLRLVPALFPASDAQHPVTTCTRTLLAQYLAQCEVTSVTHAIAGLLVAETATVFAEDGGEKHFKFIPELLGFLSRVLDGFASEKIAKPPATGPKSSKKKPSKKKSKKSKEDTDDDDESDDHIVPIPISRLGKGVSGPRFGPDHARAAVSLTCALVHRVALTYEPLASFPELFAPLRSAVSHLAAAWSLPSAAKIAREISAMLDESTSERQPAGKVPKAAPSIETLAPAFSERYTPHRDNDPDRARAEMRRLRREVAKETKAAARELRKDNMFIEEERQRIREQEDAEYRDRIKGIMATLEGQQHEMKVEKHLKRKEQLKRKDATAAKSGRR